MNPKPFYKAETLVIAAGDSRTVQRVSNFITCLEATADFRIQIDNTPETDFQKGLTFNTDIEFNEVRFVNNGADELTIRIGFGRGGVRDGRLVLAGSYIETREVAKKWQKPEEFLHPSYPPMVGNRFVLSQISFRILARENPNRLKLAIFNESSTVSVEVRSSIEGGSNATHMINPRETLELEGTNMVTARAYNYEGDANVTLSELAYV